MDQALNAVTHAEPAAASETGQPAFISIEQLLRALRRQALLIACFTVAGVALAVAYLRVAEYSYTVKLSVTASTSSPTLPGRLGGLASLAGVALPASDADRQFALYLDGLQSREAAQSLIQDRPDILRRIFWREWDAAAQKWSEPHRGVVGTAVRTAREVLGVPQPAWRPPSPERLSEWLREELVITRIRDKPTVEISLQISDPELGKQLLASLNASADSYLRARAMGRATRRIQYLRSQLQTITVDTYRQALIDELANQEKWRMMASSDESFAAESFGAPVSSRLPTKPQPALVLVAALLVGIGIGAGVALWRDRRRRLSTPVEEALP